MENISLRVFKYMIYRSSSIKPRPMDIRVIDYDVEKNPSDI